MGSAVLLLVLLRRISVLGVGVPANVRQFLLMVLLVPSPLALLLGKDPLLGCQAWMERRLRRGHGRCRVARCLPREHGVLVVEVDVISVVPELVAASLDGVRTAADRPIFVLTEIV